MAVSRLYPLLQVTLPLLVLLCSSSNYCVEGFFAKMPFTKHNVNINAAADQHHQHQHQHQRLMSASSTDGVQRNMFHDYDKPIVLVGCSSTSGNELVRLAESLSDPLSTGTSTTSIVQLASTSTDASTLSLLDVSELVAAIQAKEYKWPNVIVMDWNDPLFQLEDGKHAESLETYYQQVASTLYEEGLLSIYVNVDEHDDIDGADADTDRKDLLEEKVFLPLTDYEVCIRQEGTQLESAVTDDWKHIEWEFTRILARARLVPAIPGDTTIKSNTAHLTMGDNMFFLSLTFPDIKEVEPYVQEMCLDVDAMEYRTDLLNCRESRFDLLYGMQLLRRYCRPHALRVPSLATATGASAVLQDVMPIVYTVRTQNQAGTYPDDEAGIAKMFQILQWGLRAGVEVLDVESAWDAAETKALLDKAEERYSTQILGSHHVVGTQITTEEGVELFEQCAFDGRAHAAKVVLSIETEANDRMAYEAALIASELAEAESMPNIPKISLILGDVGQFSRVINLPFTPVTHEALPFSAAPGQMTPSEIMTTRLLTGIFQPKKYAILGHNIAYSVSPQMHGAAFSATKLAHEYVRVDVATVAEFVESGFFKSDDFGGTSVTIPHKQSIMPYMDVLSQAAREIGSVNTVIAKVSF
jgi:3-dehydroquinate dehydratase type I